VIPVKLDDVDDAAVFARRKFDLKRIVESSVIMHRCRRMKVCDSNYLVMDKKCWNL